MRSFQESASQGSRSTSPTLADALVLVFTPGVSLAEWRRTGLLEREWALYEALGPRYGRVVFVTWGGREDLEIGNELSGRIAGKLSVLCPREGESDEEFRAAMGEHAIAELAGARSVVVKTNQLEAGIDAIAVVRAARRSGVEGALVGRGGFLWSRFVAESEGAESRLAAQAGACEGALCAEADVVVGTTPAMIEGLCWRYGVASDRAVVVPNYVICGPELDTCTRRDGAAVLFAGRFAEQKRVGLLVRGVAEAERRMKASIPLRLVGAGPLRKEIEALASSRGHAGDQARIPHGDPMGEMRSCRVYAQVSAYEGHPKTVLEAMGRARRCW